MTRNILVFLVAVGLGALTVSGQDDGNEADLKRRIRALTDELKQRADAGKPKDGAAGRPVLRIYEIGDLTMMYPHAEARRVDLVPSKYQPPESGGQDEPESPFQVDSMIEMIRSIVEPESWDTIEWADIQPRGGRLFINTIPRVHRKIDAFLATLRRLTDRQLRVELFAVPIDAVKDAALLNARKRELTAEEANRLLGRKSMGSVEVICRSNQAQVQQVGRRVGYLRDYDVEIAQEATIGDPIYSQAFSGMTVHVRPMLDLGGKGARLDVALDRTKLHEPIRRVDTEHGPLELPELALTRLRTSVWMPLGKAAILGGGTAGDKPCLIVGRVSRVTTK